MESEQHCELRSRSRSRSQTPLVQCHALTESGIIEHHYDLRSRSRERSRTPGDSTSHRRSGSRTLPSSSSKIHDQSMETIIETKGETTIIGNSFEHRHKRAENPFGGAKKAERRSERQKARREIFANGQNDNKEDLSVRKNEKKYKGASPHRTFTSDYSSEEGEREDLCNKSSSAHEIYKQAGDWWNVFPKTDYTYSEKSQCRYEIAPGVLAMPNMSRRSIHSHMEIPSRLSQDISESGIYEAASIEEKNERNERNEKNAQNYRSSSEEFHEPAANQPNILNSDAKSRIQFTKTHVEQYRCHREVIYTVPRSTTDSRSRHSVRSDSPLKCIDSRKCNITSAIDSDVELDDTLSVSSKSNGRRKIPQQLRNFTATIVLWFSKLLEFLKLKTVRRRGYYEYNIYESKWSKVWQYTDHCLHYIYLFMVKVFFFDSWLLSRASSIRGWIQQRSSKLFWIVLLPLLLLTGCWCSPYLSTLLPLTSVITRQNFRETSSLVTSDKCFVSNGEDFGKMDDLNSIAEKLSSKINNLEDRTTKQSNCLLNISKTLEQLNGNDPIWSKFNRKMLTLEKKLEDHKSEKAYASEIESIKLQFNALKELYFEIKSCCDTHARLMTNEDLEKRIETILSGYFGTSVSKKDLVKIIENLAIASDGKYSETLGDKWSTSSDNFVTEDRVREIVKEALRVYDADKTGRVDYALESAGGQIISTRCTQRYDIKTRAFKLLAFTLYHENNNPRTVIQGNPIQPGACWAFQGFPGYLLIKLRSPVRVTGFTVEHAPKSILPNGEMRSAPRKFNVWGFIDENDPVPVMFGDYEFAASDDSLQYFPVQNTTIETPYEYVELRVHSNHGQLEYTCLYRFRVHGRLV